MEDIDSYMGRTAVGYKGVTDKPLDYEFTEVGTEITLLDETLETFEKTIALLRDRLQPVMVDVPLSSGPAEAEAEERERLTPLGRRIARLNRGFTDLHTALDSTYHRIGL